MVRRRLEREERDGHVVELEDAPLDSIELKKGAKGQYTWSVKLYGSSAEELLDRLFKIAEEIEVRIVDLEDR